MADLTLSGLRVVVEVARAGSFSAAAAELGYTQSAVSRQVAAMEKAAGGRLFERQARGVRPTVTGEVLVRHAQGVLDRVAGATQELAGLRERLAGRLAVGGYPTVTAVLLPRAIARLTAAHPGLRVQLLQASTPAALKALRGGRVEVAVLATGEGLPEYDLGGLCLAELRLGLGMGVAVAETHPLAVRSSVEPHELASQQWVVGPSGGAPEFGAWPGIEEPRIAFVARDWLTRLGLVAAGLGIALVPGAAAAAVPQGVRWIPVRGDDAGLRRTAWAVTGDLPGAGARAMVQALEAEAEALGSTVRRQGAG